MASDARDKLRVAVLGGSGFLGRHACEALEACGATVRSFSRRSGCDLLDLETAGREIGAFRPHYLVNCAAMVGSVKYVSDRAADIIDVNMRMLLNVYRIARDLKDTVVVNPIANCAYPASLDVYEEERFEDGPIHPSVLSYGSTRRMMRALAACYAAQYSVPSVNLGVPNMYGPLDSTDPDKTHAINALVIKFLRAKRAGDAEVEVWGTGAPVREWLYVKDLAAVFALVVRSGTASLDLVNVGQNKGYSVREIVEVVRRQVGHAGKVVYNPRYPDGGPRRVMSDRLFRRHFSEFSFTPLDQGLQETIRYYECVL